MPSRHAFGRNKGEQCHLALSFIPFGVQTRLIVHHPFRDLSDDGPGELIAESSAVAVIPDDVQPVLAASHEVMKRARILNAETSCHALM